MSYRRDRYRDRGYDRDRGQRQHLSRRPRERRDYDRDRDLSRRHRSRRERSRSPDRRNRFNRRNNRRKSPSRSESSSRSMSSSKEENKVPKKVMMEKGSNITCEIDGAETDVRVTSLESGKAQVAWFNGFLNMEQWISIAQITHVEGVEVNFKKKAPPKQNEDKKETSPPKEE